MLILQGAWPKPTAPEELRFFPTSGTGESSLAKELPAVHGDGLWVTFESGYTEEKY